MPDLMSTRNAAERLRVSTATVYNWVKNGLLQSVGTSFMKFDPVAVDALATAIAAGDIPRLRSRANKCESVRNIMPWEYRGTAATPVRRLKQLKHAGNLDTERAIFIATMAVLSLRGEVRPPAGKTLRFHEFSDWRRDAVRTLMRQWYQSLGRVKIASCYREFFDAAQKLPVQGDVLGFLYQSLRREGVRAQGGAYYTPPELATTLLNRWKPEGTLLDPGCGTGQFLLAAATLGWHFDQLYGVELDPLAARLTALNLLLAFPGEDRLPHIRCGNSLCAFPFQASPRFHLVATNPPWGRIAGEKSRSILRKECRLLGTYEAFNLFLLRAVEWAEPGGGIVFILPEAMLNIRRHTVIRELLLERTAILRLERLGRRFHGVSTGALTLEAVNTRPAPDHQLELRTAGDSRRRVLQRNCSADGIVLRHNPAPQEAAILEKLRRIPHRTLAGHAEWALGIVTGDNRRFLLLPGTAGAEPVLRGPEVLPFRLAPAGKWIRFAPEEHQQNAPLRLYRAPLKLVYRFISNHLTVALDRSGALTLNSANSLIVEAGYYPMETVAALFNSQLYQLLFRGRFNTHKVLRRDLEELPLPLFAPEALRRLGTLAASAAAGDPEAAAAIDALLAELLELTAPERELLALRFGRRPLSCPSPSPAPPPAAAP